MVPSVAAFPPGWVELPFGIFRSTHGMFPGLLAPQVVPSVRRDHSPPVSDLPVKRLDLKGWCMGTESNQGARVDILPLIRQFPLV